MPDRDLATLQRSMWASIVGGTADAAFVAGSRGPSADDRVAVYAHAYRTRLLGCLGHEFSLLRATVGDQVFDLFARGYLAACPPRTPSMHDLGDRFADHLAATRPPLSEDPGGLAALPAELARLDRAVAESRRAPGVEDEPPSPVPDLAVLLVRPEVRLHTPASLRLLATGFDLVPVAHAVAGGARPDVPTPTPTPSHCAVARAGHRVRVLALTPLQHAFLDRCGPDGAEFAAAAQLGAEAAGTPSATAWVALATWLPGAVAAGMVVVEAV